MTRKRDNHVNQKLTAFDLGYKKDYTQKVTTATARTITISEEDWPLVDDRINAIGQNGNTGEHYEELV